jgi:hypothetical protein
MAILKGFPPSSSISPGPRIRTATRWEQTQEIIDMAEPLTMLDMMGKVLNNPTMYLAEANIFKFEDFWHGWTLGRVRPDENKFMLAFYDWTIEKVKSKCPRENGWAFMFHQLAKEKQREESDSLKNKPLRKSDDILFCSKRSEELALDYLATYWFRFIQETPAENFPYDTEKAKHVKPWRTIDDL